MQLLRAVLSIGLLSISQVGWSQDAAPTGIDPEVLEELAEVVVHGEQPGPALWQVRSGDHTLWILGEVSPLPVKVRWRSKQVEGVLASAQEVVVPAGIRDGGPRPAADPTTPIRRIAPVEGRKPADGETLKDVLSPESYARFEVARLRFAKGEKGFERLTPEGASTRLFNSALKALKLAPGPHLVSITVSKHAQKAAINIVHVDVDTSGQEPPRTTNDLPAACRPPEPLLAQLDDGGLGWRALANAWSIGDIDALRVLVPAHEVHAVNAERCAFASDGNERTHSEALARRRDAWLGALERALATNQSSLAVVKMVELFAADGLIAAFRARGYEVIEPSS